jgi:hypothetical protein
MSIELLETTKAQESRNAIERLYIEMRHLLISGTFKPSGISGKVLREALRTLSPEIYGLMTDINKVELDGLVYVIDRLPKGLEECRYVKLTSEEGFNLSNFPVIIPPKRVRNCYRVDKEQMIIEVTRGRSEIYDILTHLTFLYNEAHKIVRHSFNEKGEPIREWLKLEEIVQGEVEITEENHDKAFTYLSTILGRTFEETKSGYARFEENPEHNNGFFHIIYWLGKVASEEYFNHIDREVSFSPTLRERIGRHIYGEKWAYNIKKALLDANLIQRPVHIISANLHSVLNTLFAYGALHQQFKKDAGVFELALELRKPETDLDNQVIEFAQQHGMITLYDSLGTNLTVQIFDMAQVSPEMLAPELLCNAEYLQTEKPVIIVMDYAFGEQAYETMDELLKPLKISGKEIKMNVASISIMGKAGILEGDKGDIMIPTAHVFEGTADNYPFENEFKATDFEGNGVNVFEGAMITVLGTSLQNRDVLEYFKNSSWRAVGLEMEGAHYQKAIQAESMIRKNISNQVVIRYAYYASDNPLLTGSTLASGSLGLVGVKPTYLITIEIIKKILGKSK